MKAGNRLPHFGEKSATSAGHRIWRGIKRIVAELRRGNTRAEKRAGSDRSVGHALLRLEGLAFGFVKRYPDGKDK
jgi:hypothetical protein